MLYRSIYIGNPAHLKLKDKQLKITDPHYPNCSKICPRVVINHKTTKFESNSQPSLNVYGKEACCYQSQNYKI